MDKSAPGAGVGGGLHSGVAGAVRAILAQFPGMGVSSTTGGGHAKNSYHYRGEAADLVGPNMNAEAAWIKSHMARGLTEGIHNPNLSVKYGRLVPPSYWGGTTWADHVDHIHVAVAGGGPTGWSGLAGGGPVPKIKRRMVGGGGALGTLGQAAADDAAAAANRAVRRAATATYARGKKGGWFFARGKPRGYPPATVHRGRASWYGGPHDKSDLNPMTAYGYSHSHPGISLREALFNRRLDGPARSRHAFYRVVSPGKRVAVLPLIDKGPGIPSRGLDVGAGALRMFGFNEGNFPTDKGLWRWTGPYWSRAEAGGGTGRGARRYQADADGTVRVKVPPRTYRTSMRESWSGLWSGLDADDTGRGIGRISGETYRRVLEGLALPSEDLPTVEEVPASVAARMGRRTAPTRVRRALDWAARYAHKGLGYAYGGGHKRFGRPGPQKDKRGRASFDCSGFVGGALQAAGIRRGANVSDDYLRWGKHGKGGSPWGVTVGVKPGSGKSGHVMMKLGPHYLEANSRGVGFRGGWNPAVTKFRHYARGKKPRPKRAPARGRPTGRPHAVGRPAPAPRRGDQPVITQQQRAEEAERTISSLMAVPTGNAHLSQKRALVGKLMRELNAMTSLNMTVRVHDYADRIRRRIAAGGVKGTRERDLMRRIGETKLDAGGALALINESIGKKIDAPGERAQDAISYIEWVKGELPVSLMAAGTPDEDMVGPDGNPVLGPDGRPVRSFGQKVIDRFYRDNIAGLGGRANNLRNMIGWVRRQPDRTLRTAALPKLLAQLGPGPDSVLTEITHLQAELAERLGTKASPAATADAAAAGGPDFAQQLRDLQAQANDLLREQNSILAGQSAALAGFAPLAGGRYVGAFAAGGPIVQTGMAMVHRGEYILPSPDGPHRASPVAAAAPQVTVIVEGDVGALVGRIRAEVDGRAAQVVAEQQGRRTRVLAGAGIAARGIRGVG